MAKSPANVLADILHAASVTTNGSQPITNTRWAMKVGVMQNAPDRQIGLLDTGGHSNPKWLLDTVTVQAIIRSGREGYQEGYDKAKQVKDVLLGIEPTVFDTSSNLVGVTIQSDIAFMHIDDNARALFSINFRLIIQPAPSAETNRVDLGDVSA